MMVVPGWVTTLVILIVVVVTEGAGDPVDASGVVVAPKGDDAEPVSIPEDTVAVVLEADVVGSAGPELVSTPEETVMVALPPADVNTELAATPEETGVVPLPATDVETGPVGTTGEAIVLGFDPLTPELALGQKKAVEPEAIEAGFEEAEVPGRAYEELAYGGNNPLGDGLVNVNVPSELVVGLGDKTGLVAEGIKDVKVPSVLVFEGLAPVVESLEDTSVPSETVFELKEP